MPTGKTNTRTADDARKDAQRSEEGGGAYIKKSPITEDTE